MQTTFSFTCNNGVFTKKLTKFNFTNFDKPDGGEWENPEVTLIPSVPSLQSKNSVGSIFCLWRKDGLQNKKHLTFYILRLSKQCSKVSDQDLAAIIGHELGHIPHHIMDKIPGDSSSDCHSMEYEADLYAAQSTGTINGMISYLTTRHKPYFYLIRSSGGWEIGINLDSFQVYSDFLDDGLFSHPSTSKRLANLEGYARERGWDYSCVTRARKERRKRQLKWTLASVAAVGAAYIGSQLWNSRK